METSTHAQPAVVAGGAVLAKQLRVKALSALELCLDNSLLAGLISRALRLGVVSPLLLGCWASPRLWVLRGADICSNPRARASRRRK